MSITATIVGTIIGSGIGASLVYYVVLPALNKYVAPFIDKIVNGE